MQQFEASFPELCEKFRQEKESKKQKRKGIDNSRMSIEYSRGTHILLPLYLGTNSCIIILSRVFLFINLMKVVVWSPACKAGSA